MQPSRQDPDNAGAVVAAHTRQDYLLAGLAWCAGCSGPLVPFALTAEARSYDCHHGCRMRWLDAVLVDGLVLAAAYTSLLVRTERFPWHGRRAIVAQAFSRITVGGSETDLTFVPPVPHRRQQPFPRTEER